MLAAAFGAWLLGAILPRLAVPGIDTLLRWAPFAIALVILGAREIWLNMNGARRKVESQLITSVTAPIRSEIDPAPLMRNLAEQGAKLALPAVMARGKSLAFRAWSPDDRLMMGPLGILEPSPAAAELVPDIMLVPLAAFDRQGHRIGYGAGHYDFTLAHLRKAKVITAVGTAFAVQEIKAVPALPHDVALDYVLTEKKVFDFRS